jgi:UDP-N-acetylmuramoyl-tripeptide--D-alanyl-D-alanine ligase
MYELGSYSYDEHIRILQLARDEGIEHIWIVGAEFTRANDSLHIAEQVFDNTDQLRASLSTKGLTDKTILIKGSRAMRLENVLDII